MTNGTPAVVIHQPSLEIDGFFYEIQFVAEINDGEEGKVMPINLDDVQTFSISSKFNRFEAEATLVFGDSTGTFDRYSNNQKSYIDVSIECYKRIVEGKVVNYKQIASINQLFLINASKILQRHGTKTIYEVQLVSSNSVNLRRNIKAFTNREYGFYELVQKYLRDIGVMTCHDFDRYDTQKDLRYVSGGFDTIYQIYNYLTDKVYSNFKNLPTGVRGVYYDFYSNSVHPVILGMDPQNSHTVKVYSKDHPIPSMLEGNTRDVKLGTVTRMSNLDALYSHTGHRCFSYDYESNSFGVAIADTNEMMKIFGSGDDLRRLKTFMPSTKHLDTGEKLVIDDNLVDISEWDNPSYIYTNMVRNLMDYNSLIVRRPGLLGVNVGDVIMIAIPDKTEDEEDANRLKEIEGGWIVGKHENIFNFQDMTFD